MWVQVKCWVPGCNSTAIRNLNGMVKVMEWHVSLCLQFTYRSKYSRRSESLTLNSNLNYSYSGIIFVSRKIPVSTLCEMSYEHLAADGNEACTNAIAMKEDITL